MWLRSVNVLHSYLTIPDVQYSLIASTDNDLFQFIKYNYLSIRGQCTHARALKHQLANLITKYHSSFVNSLKYSLTDV